MPNLNDEMRLHVDNLFNIFKLNRFIILPEGIVQFLTEPEKDVFAVLEERVTEVCPLRQLEVSLLPLSFSCHQLHSQWISV